MARLIKEHTSDPWQGKEIFPLLQNVQTISEVYPTSKFTPTKALFSAVQWLKPTSTYCHDL
jgi:hypothetical protein